jgi:hypothetical protein
VKRNKLLELFASLRHVRFVVEAWRMASNNESLTRGLGVMTPAAYANTLIRKQLI